EGDGIASLRLEQRAPEQYPTLRPHHVEIALLREDGGAIVVESVPGQIEGRSAEVPAATGLPAPAFVYPNHGDHAFAKIALDDASLEFIRGGLDRIDDALLRQLIWQTLWQMV